MELMLIGGPVLMMVLLMAWIYLTFYKKCPPNAAMIISGIQAGAGGSNQFKIVVGGGAVVLPMIQQVNYLSLEVFEVEVKPSASMSSSDNVPLFVSGIAQVKVRGDDLSIATAAECLLGKERNEVVALAQQIIIGSLRQTIASMTASGVVKNLDGVVALAVELAIVDLSKMGLTIVSFSITEVRDEVGYLDLLAREQVERKRQEVQG